MTVPQTTTEPTPAAPAQATKISPLITIVCMTAVVIGLLIAYVVLTSTHHDASQLLTVLVAIIGAGIPGVAALSKTNEVSQAVTYVQHLTNGNMSRLIALAEHTVGAQIETALSAHTTAQRALEAIPAVPIAHPAEPVQPAAGPPPVLPVAAP